MFARNVVGGYPIFPDGFVIAAGNWSPSALEVAWSTASPVPASDADL
jgi:hypothetical protein